MLIVMDKSCFQVGGLGWSTLHGERDVFVSHSSWVPGWACVPSRMAGQDSFDLQQACVEQRGLSLFFVAVTQSQTKYDCYSKIYRWVTKTMTWKYCVLRISVAAKCLNLRLATIRSKKKTIPCRIQFVHVLWNWRISSLMILSQLDTN